MGYSVNICPVKKRNGKVVIKNSVEYTSMTSNFNNLSEICLSHYLSNGCSNCLCTNNISCSCEKTHIWFFETDCHNRLGKDVAKRAKKALKILSKIGISVDNVSEQKLRLSGYGLQWPKKDQLEFFAYHINIFLNFGKKYPKYVFLGDNGCKSESEPLPENVYIDILSEDSSSDNDFF